MTLIYDVKVISQEFLFNIPLFSQTHGERMKKIGSILREILNVFTLSIKSIFHLENED